MARQSVASKRQAVIDAAAQRSAQVENLVNALLDSLDTAIINWRNEQSTQLSALEALNSDVNQNLADLKGELEEVRDNMEERFSGTERYERVSELVSELDSVGELSTLEGVDDVDHTSVGSLIESLNELINSAAEMSGTLGGISVEG